MRRQNAGPVLRCSLLLLLVLTAVISGGCASTAAPSPAAEAPAQKAGTCATNQQCAPNEFCARFYDSCGDRGKCEERPTDCTERGKLLVRPVCGCDQKTYDNACLAAAAGASVKSEGQCSGPAAAPAAPHPPAP
jgi:Kazal-type serine protease inhibitor domain